MDPICRLAKLVGIYMPIDVNLLDVVPGWHDKPIVDRYRNRGRMGKNKSHAEAGWQLKLRHNRCKVVAVSTQTV